MRVAFVVLSVLQGAGLLVYAALWALVPQAAAPGAAPPSRWSRRTQLLLLGTLALAGSVLIVGSGRTTFMTVAPLIAAAVGVALIWRQADAAQRSRWAQLSRHFGGPRALRSVGWLAILQLVVGMALVLAGMAGFLATHHALTAARQGVLATVVVVAGLALVTAPVWWRLVRELSDERRERIRSEERAELAGRVHDSVLQTLTLIQRHAEDPRQVQRLARGSERELRTWLYRPAADAAERFGAAVEAAAADVEDAHGMAFEVVGVGDRRLDERLAAMVAAAREAMINAAKYSAAAGASVFYEVEADRVELFVRDRGRGFNPTAVPADRFGIRESIVGRMTRHGGSAMVRSTAGGTEVELVLPLSGTRST